MLIDIMTEPTQVYDRMDGLTQEMRRFNMGHVTLIQRKSRQLRWRSGLLRPWNIEVTLKSQECASDAEERKKEFVP